MSFKPLLDPSSTDNKTLDLYCHSITTATGGNSPVVLHQPHTGLSGYMGDNPINANLNIILDQRQLIRKDGKYAQISGSCVIQITDINYSSFRIIFNNPLSSVDAVYLVGSGVIPPTPANSSMSASSASVGVDNKFNIVFNRSTGAVFPSSPTNITLTYSVVVLLV